MKSAEQPYQTFWMRHAAPPRQGAASSLAGVAERGDRLVVLGLGEFVNVGSKEAPDWQPYQPKRSVFITVAEWLSR